MKKDMTLVVMAAGMGSRFGGLKQVTPVGPCEEKLIEYAAYDAKQAGFNKVVFIIKKAIEEEFKANIGSRLEKYIAVDYVYQELDRLPEGFTVPEGRVKPWGTGHAIMCCEGVVTTPFAVINADDYYGAECFGLIADFFAKVKEAGKMQLTMVGYRLENTLTENGSVSRGVCVTDENSLLTSITERTRIEWHEGEPAFTEDGGETWEGLTRDTTVSMNCWGFPAEALSEFKRLFADFLTELAASDKDPLKAEFYLPFAVDTLMKEGKADATVLTTADKWYGMTYKEDQIAVVNAIAQMVKDGKYPAPLWSE